MTSRGSAPVRVFEIRQMPDNEREDAPVGSPDAGVDGLRVKPDRRQRHELRFRGLDGRRAEDPLPEPAPEDDQDPPSPS